MKNYFIGSVLGVLLVGNLAAGSTDTTIWATGSSRFIAISCTSQVREEAEEEALAEAKKEAESICEGEATAHPNPIVHSQCSLAGKEVSVSAAALVKYTCGNSLPHVVKQECNGSCQTTGPHSCTAFYSDGSTAHYSVKVCK